MDDVELDFRVYSWCAARMRDVRPLRCEFCVLQG